MKLVQIDVENFMTYKFDQVPIPDGITLLWGKSGSGKSSLIIDAVGFALFGVSATRWNKNQMLLSHWDKDSPAKVILVLETNDGMTIEIERGVNPKGVAWARASDTKGTDINGPTPVAAYIHQLLGGIDWQTFFLSFVARQEEISQLTQLKGGDRREYVHQLLGLGNLDKATTIARRRSRDQATQITVLEKHLQGVQAETLIEQLQQHEQQLQQQETLCQQQQAAEQAAADALAAAKEHAEIFQSHRVDGNELLTRQQQLNEMIEIKKGQLPALQQQIDAAQTAETLLQQHGDVDGQERLLRQQAAEQDEIRQRASQYHHQQQLVQQTAEQMKTVQTQLDTLQQQLDALVVPADPRSLSQLESTQAELRASYKELRRRQQELADNLQQLEVEGVCSTCLRPATGEHAQQLRQQFAQVEAALQTEQAAIANEGKQLGEAIALQETYSQQHQRLRQQYDTYQRQQEQLAAQQRTQQQTVTELTAAGDVQYDEAAHQQILQQIKELGTIAGDIAQAKVAVLHGQQATTQQAALQQEIAAHQTEREQVQAAIQTLGYDVAGDQAAQQQLQQATEQHSQAALTANASASKLRELTQTVAEQQQRLKDVQAQTISLQEHRHQRQQLEDLVEAFAGFKRHMATQIRPELEHMCSEMFAQLSQAKFAQIRIDENYDIDVLTDSGEWMPIRGLSGGETARANLCLRLSLTRLVSQRTGVPIRFLVFDEPLNAQDDDQRDTILAMLEDLKPFYPQVLFISHDQDLLDNAHIGAIMQFEPPTKPHHPPQANRVSVYAT